MSIPNLITLIRLLIVPLIISMILEDRYGTAFWLLVGAGLSDAVDGFIAKRFNSATKLGAYLDPIADKALLVSIFITLGYMGHIETWLVIVVVSRDLLIIGAVVLSYLIDHPLKISPLYVSKANTTAQIMLAALVLADLGLNKTMGVEQIILLMTYLTGITTVLSGALYLLYWVRSVAIWEEPSEP